MVELDEGAVGRLRRWARREGVEPAALAARLLTLAEAMRRAYGHRYAVVYRVLGDRHVPIIADAGSDEIVFVPTARRVHRDAIDWWLVVSDMELWRAMTQR